MQMSSFVLINMRPLKQDVQSKRKPDVAWEKYAHFVTDFQNT